MDSRGLVLAVATLAAGTALATPAAAAVTFDPGAKTGFVGGGDVQRAFGWTTAQLAARASGVAFEQDFWTDDAYTVACGPHSYPVVHHRDFGRFDLIDTVVRDRSHRAASGYAGRLDGFRIAGARSGISGTSVAPAAGQPCPRTGPAITSVRLVSTTTGWSLSARSGARTHVLRQRAVRST